jgi:Tfp pilus assembly protein PilO
MRKVPNPNLFLILAVVTFFAGTGLVGLQASSLSAKRHTVEELKGQAQDPTEVQRKLDTSKSQLDDCSSKLAHLEMGISDSAYVPTLLQQLEKFGLSNGIAVTGVRPVPKPPTKKGETETRKAYEELNLEVKGRGSYGDVMRFVSGLQTFPKIVAARTVSLQPTTDNTRKDTGDLDVTIELRAYVFPDTTASTPADGSATTPAGAKDTAPTTTAGKPAVPVVVPNKPKAGV